MSERGSAPAEFVMVSALLAALALGLMQVILVTHVRHTLLSAAAPPEETVAAPVVVESAYHKRKRLAEEGKPAPFDPDLT